MLPLPVGVDNFEKLITRGYARELEDDGYATVYEGGIYHEK